MAALRRKPVLRRIQRRKRQIIFQRYKQAGFLSIFVFLILLIVGVVVTSIYSQSSKPGDLLYPLKITIEQLQLSFTTVNPEEKIPVLISQSKNRVLEASELAPDSSKDKYFRQVLRDYKSDLTDIAYQMNEARLRDRDIKTIEPLFIESILDNLQSLTKMYDSTHLEQQDALGDAVLATADAYDAEIAKLAEKRTDLDIAGYKERFYELQQDLRGKGVLIY